MSVGGASAVAVDGGVRDVGAADEVRTRLRLRRSRPPARRRRPRVVFYGFLLPTVVVTGGFVYYPMVRALVLAFTSWDGFNPPRWIGLQNFSGIFRDPVFLASVVHVALWSAVGIPLALIPSFVTAELTFMLPSARAQYVFRTLLVIPMVLPSVVYLLIWQYVYSPSGILDGLLSQLGLSGSQAWLANPHTALWSLILMGFPWVIPFNFLILYAGLQGIGPEVLDATAVDGTKPLQRVRLVDLPLLIPQIKLLLILSVIQVSQNLLIPLVMTGGGPGNATMTPILYMYNEAISYDRYGYGMAVAVVMFIVVMLLALVNFRFLQERVE